MFSDGDVLVAPASAETPLPYPAARSAGRKTTAPPAAQVGKISSTEMSKPKEVICAARSAGPSP